MTIQGSTWERMMLWRSPKGKPAKFQKKSTLAQKAACKITAQGVELEMGERIMPLDAARVAAMVVRCGNRASAKELPTPTAYGHVAWIMEYLGTRRANRPVRISMRTYGVLVKYGREK